MAAKKILLMTPPGQVFLFADGRPAHRKHCTPPLGLAYLAAHLLRGGYEVEVLDILAEGYHHEEIWMNSIVYGVPIPEMLERIRKAKPDVIGLSYMFSSVTSSVNRLLAAIKKEFPDMPILVGGQHPTGSGYEVMKNTDIDFALRGEADETIVQFMDALSGKRALEDVTNLLYRKDGKVVNTMSKYEPVVKGEGWDYYRARESGVPMDLDGLPRPAWHLFPMESYWKVDVRVSGGDALAERYAVMQSTRGCPHACYYCTSPLLSGFRGYRKRTNDAVMDEIRWLIDTYKVGEVMFLDDNFFVSKPRAKELVKRIGEEFPNTHFSVPGGTDINHLDEEMMDLLAKANFHKLTLNVESGNQDLQNALIDKKVNLGRVPQVVDALKARGIETRAMLMIGFPGETRASIDKTVQMARSLNVDDFFLSIVSPLPGTPLFDECKEKNLFIEGFSLDEIRYSLSTIKLPETSPEELENIRKTAWQEAFEERREKMQVFEKKKHHKFKDIEEYETFGFKILEKNKKEKAAART